MTNQTFTREQVLTAINRAVEEVLQAHGPQGDDQLVNDCLNLAANATIHFLQHPSGTLNEAIYAYYEREPEEVLGWVRA